MKRKIMITLDGSELSKKVLSAIRQLFPATETELILLQVIDPLTYTPYVTPMSPSLTWDPQLIEHEWVDHRRMIVEEMNSTAHKLEAEGFHVRAHIPVGDPIKEICALARDEKVDLLAMATHGRTGIMRILMGSVAEGVMRSTSVPLLLIHPEEKSSDEKISDKKSGDEKSSGETITKEHEHTIDAQHMKARKSEVVYETPSV